MNEAPALPSSLLRTDGRPKRTQRPWPRLSVLAAIAALGPALLCGTPAERGVAAEARLAARPAGFADIVDKVKPAVISVRVSIPAGRKGSQSEDTPLDRFFRRFGLPNGVPERPRGRVTGQGSGFFISADGYAVTNFHVVDKTDSVEVTTDDGRTFKAKVIGADERSDIAVIKVEGRQFPLRAVRRCDAAYRRLGDRGRQSVRPWRQRDRRHRFWPRPRHRGRPL